MVWKDLPWESLVVSIVSGLVVLIIQLLIGRFWGDARHATGGASQTNSGVVNGDQTQVVDQRETTVINNYIDDTRRSRDSNQASASNDDQAGLFVFVALVGLVLAGLFVVHYELVRGVLLGLLGGWLVGALIAVGRASRSHLWPRGAVLIVGRAVMVAAAAGVMVWALGWGDLAGRTFRELSDEVDGAVASSGATGIGALLAPATELINLGSDSVFAVVQVFLGLASLLAVLAFSFIDLVNWQAYMGLGVRLNGSSWRLKRAHMVTRGGGPETAATLILSALSVLLSTQAIWHWTDALRAAPVLS